MMTWILNMMIFIQIVLKTILVNRLFSLYTFFIQGLFSFKDFFHSTVGAETDPDVRTCLVQALDFTYESGQ